MGTVTFLSKLALTSSPALLCLGNLGFLTNSCKLKSALTAGLPCLHICRTISLTLIEGDKQLTGELNPFVGESVLSSARNWDLCFQRHLISQVNIILSVI